MKRIVLFVLLFAAVAVSAFAVPPQFERPLFGRLYFCDYSNYSGPAKDPGYSWWEYRSETANIIYTYEHFLLPNGNYENYKANWAKPVLLNIYGKTEWEFTFLNGPQCTSTIVYPGGSPIAFSGCSDGHSRTCWVQ
jgi:hypothetical protein